VSSNALDIKVNAKPSISIISQDGIAVNKYSQPVITATIAGAATTPKIRWYLNNNLVANNDKLEYRSGYRTNGDQIYATLESNADCGPVATLSSNKIIFEVLVAINEGNIQKIGFYPNPVTDILTIDANEIDGLVIYDQLGIEVLRSDKLYVDIASLAAGIYTLEVSKDGNTFMARLLKK
jgi:hypothetical protein